MANPSAGGVGSGANLEAWAVQQPLWMQDALRRLLIQETLTAADIDALTLLCRTGGDGAKGVPPSGFQHVGLDGAAVSLLKVGSPININALASDQSLEFGRNGLTIIYGDNGVGKSGYVRILKHACRARPPRQVVHPQVKDIGREVSQSASITYQIGDRQENREWTPGGAPIIDLHNVSIFDSRSAATHVEIENEVAYTPFPMRILSKLANACDEVTAKLSTEIEQLKGKTPEFIRAPKLNPKTAAGDYLIKLSAKSNLETLEKLCAVSETEQTKFDGLDLDLAQDPKIASGRLENQSKRITEYIASLSRQLECASSAASTTCEQLSTALKLKVELAAAASQAMFGAAPLSGVGDDLWLALWEAGKAYGRHVNGEEKAFPSDFVEGDHCLLCQQPILPDTVTRLLTFEAFVEGSAKAGELEARQAWQSHVTTTKSSLLSIQVIKDFVAFLGKELADPTLAELVRSVSLRSRRIAKNLLRGDNLVIEFENPLGSLRSRAEVMRQRASALTADSQSAGYLALKFEHSSLKDRLSLASIKADVLLEIDRRKTIALLEARQKDARKRPVTDKNKELSSVLITDALRGQFAREISGFRVGKMPIELIKTKDSNATSYFKVVLVEHPKAKLGDILSEGEHRCVALAAFLAELATANNESGIVFDDPMSSLDHLHRERVAARLVIEAKRRQVVVFTHDLTFLGALRRVAEEEQVEGFFQTVVQRSAASGVVEGDLPLKGKSALQASSALKGYLKQNKGRFNEMADVERKVFASGFIAQLREVWDQGIADYISPVLGRFDNKIKGSSLAKLTILTSQDIETIDAARGRLSEDLHNRAEALNPEEVSADQLLEEIKTVEAWLTNVQDRQKAVRTRGDR